ncbi:hypothetical protein PAXINDRAFT_35468, partial [Paxillus involutus ATCC 200175]
LLQAGHVWNCALHEKMVSWGFTRLQCEHCIYYHCDDHGTIICAIHVDTFLNI